MLLSKDNLLHDVAGLRRVENCTHEMPSGVEAPTPTGIHDFSAIASS